MTRCHVRRVVDKTKEKIIGTPGPDLAGQTLEQIKGAEIPLGDGAQNSKRGLSRVTRDIWSPFNQLHKYRYSGITFYNDVVGSPVLRSHSMETFY